MERDKYFSSLLHSTCERLSSFFSSETQKKIYPIVRKIVSRITFKKWPFANDFRNENEDEKFLAAKLGRLVVKNCENFPHHVGI